jgi:hypothetical protein
VGDREAAGTAAALDFARRVAAPPAAGADDPLDRVGFLVVPAPNPDALAAFLAGGAHARGGGNVDRDRDGVAGEDGPEDVDGDGEILWMRRRSPTGRMAVDDAPPGADGRRAGDPRLLRDAGVDVRRAVSYEPVTREGKDGDGDGEIDEDPPGVDVADDFLGDWTEHGAWPGDAPFPGFTPEARALMDLSYGVENLVAWYELTSEGPRLERASEHGKDGDADDEAYGRLAAAWKAASGLETRKASERPGLVPRPSSALDWAATHLGVLAVRVPVWRIEKDAGNARERADPDELDWLLWNDRVLAGRGFAPWREVTHPQGPGYEVGGWRRFTHHEPPADLLPAAVRRVSWLPAVHAGFAPRLALDVEVVRLAGALVRVRARVQNVGGGALETAGAKRAHRSADVRMTLSAPGAVLVAGPGTARVPPVEAGASSDVVEWTWRAPAGPLGTLEARHRVAGAVAKEVVAP